MEDIQMTENQTLKDAMTSYFASKEEMAELQKAITTADGSAGDLQPIEYDAELLNLLVLKSPLFARLKAIGKVKPSRSSINGWREKATGGVSEWIAETDDTNVNTSSTYESHTSTQKVLIHPIEISDLAQLGGQDVLDVMRQEIQDAMLDIAWRIDYSLINNVDAATTWGGLAHLVATNTHDLTGDALSKDDLRSMCNTVIAAGGTPTAILTGPDVAGQLEDELYPGVRNVNQVEMVTGYNVTAFRAPNGTDIPIIVDTNVPNVDGARECYVLDETIMEFRELLPPTPIPMAKTKLTETTVLATFNNFFMRAQQWCGRIYGID
jgi:hypothetical protein